jgi:large subunit ribosomal protein L35
MKTHKAGAKRYRLTAGGKFKRNQAGRNHLNQKKSSKQKQRLDQPALVHETCYAKLRLQLPYANHVRG